MDIIIEFNRKYITAFDSVTLEVDDIFALYHIFYGGDVNPWLSDYVFNSMYNALCISFDY